jgi:membrane-bound serine protease (ClpP class)
MVGVALTDLRPGGTVEFDGRRLEAFSEIGFLHAGQRVRVTAVEGAKVRVREA